MIDSWKSGIIENVKEAGGIRGTVLSRGPRPFLLRTTGVDGYTVPPGRTHPP
nr:MAG TPA: hypothetical protein [Bacteriophage sp.]